MEHQNTIRYVFARWVFLSKGEMFNAPSSSCLISPPHCWGYMRSWSFQVFTRKDSELRMLVACLSFTDLKNGLKLKSIHLVIQSARFVMVQWPLKSILKSPSFGWSKGHLEEAGSCVFDRLNLNHFFCVGSHLFFFSRFANLPGAPCTWTTSRFVEAGREERPNMYPKVPRMEVLCLRRLLKSGWEFSKADPRGN